MFLRSNVKLPHVMHAYHFMHAPSTLAVFWFFNGRPHGEMRAFNKLNSGGSSLAVNRSKVIALSGWQWKVILRQKKIHICMCGENEWRRRSIYIFASTA